MSNGAEWDIKKRGELCAKTEQPFADGESIVSRLMFVDGDYVREDYTESAWDDQLGEGALSVWKTVVRFPPPPPDEPLKKETAEGLLRQFMNKEDFSRGRAIYILGLMLERKKILVEKDLQVKEDGSKLRIYEHKHTGEVFMIPDPGLKLDELEDVQEEVVVLLGGKPRNQQQEESTGSEEPAEEHADSD